MKRFSILIVMLCASTFALAQKADVAVVAGGSFVSDSQQSVFSSPSVLSKLKTDHHIYFEGALGLRMLDAKLVALYLEVPVAGIPSQKITFSSTPSTVVDHLSSIFVTPGFRLKVLPASPISPWVSVGGGLARYSADSGSPSNKGALEYGGGLDFKTGLPLLGFRAEVRDFVSGEPGSGFFSGLPTGSGGLHHHNILAGGGLVLRF
ncbi:MAG TPA: hypothetical protein VGK24_19310 [Candidatus Angelobacter sp.]|jgi:hypothetical protein